MDYIIIEENGQPHHWDIEKCQWRNGIEVEIILYGDKKEAEKDLCSTDIGLVRVEYGEKCATPCAELFFKNKKIGEVYYSDWNELDLHKQLWDFIILYDFVTKQLPH